MTLQVKEIAMTKWTQCRNANFVVTKNASRAFEKHEELLNSNFWTNLLYHRNWHFHTMLTKSLRFLALESLFTKSTKSYKTEQTRQKWNILFGNMNKLKWQLIGCGSKIHVCYVHMQGQIKVVSENVVLPKNLTKHLV